MADRNLTKFGPANSLVTSQRVGRMDEIRQEDTHYNVATLHSYNDRNARCTSYSSMSVESQTIISLMTRS